MMREKRAQEGVIVTVILVLVAIAAVAAIAYFIMGQVRSGTGQAEGKVNCLKLDLVITKAVANSSGPAIIFVTRNDDATVAISSLVTTYEGATWNASAPAPATALGIVNVTSSIPLDSTKKVEIGAILADGTSCPAVASATVTAV